MLTFSPFFVRPSVACLYAVFSPPVCSGSAEFLRVLYYYLAQNLRDGVEAVSFLDRNEGLVWILFNWLVRVFAMRSPFWVETVVCLILDHNEDFADFLSS